MNVLDYMRRLEELLAATDIIIKERDEAIRERDEARRERDEARRLASEYACITEVGVRAFARNKGWDCFKEDNHNA